ncbi:MAG TPA: twitching motility protein PilT, partial [Bacteroidetes bacterium]|nr:twitching motility protein PilT [Bacteroidota bacterium]
MEHEAAGVVHLRAYGELNDHLPPAWRGREREIVPPLRSSVKDTLESVGIPHVEVALLLLNGEPVDWRPLLRAGDRVAAYPQAAGFDFSGVSRVWDPPPRPPRFVLDVHLGRLAAYLRLLGFDTLYQPVDPKDPALVHAAVEEERVLLTCDRRLLMHGALRWGRWVRNRQPREQTAEILDRYGLRDLARPFTRCLACNGLLVPADPARVKRDAPPGALRAHGVEEFSRCPDCG